MSGQARLRSLGVRTYKRYRFPYLKELYERRLKAGLPEIKPRNMQSNWNHDVELHAFTHRISVNVSPYTLQIAFTDRSYAAQIQKLQMELIGGEQEEEIDGDIFNANDHLSTIGWTFTRQYVEEYLVSKLPHLPSEGIQALVDYLTSRNKLALIAENLGMSELVLYDGHEVPEEAVVRSLLAVIAVVKDEQGASSAQSFVQDFIVSQLIGEDLDDIYHIKNAMSLLEDVLSKQKRGKPEARLIDQSGQETLMACYYVGIYSDKLLIGKAAGESPEIATEMAARDSLITIYGIQDNRVPFDFDEEYRRNLQAKLNFQPSIESSSAN